MTEQGSLPFQDSNQGKKAGPAIQRMTERDRVVAQTGPCPLADYREMVKDLPRPTPVQIDEFVKFVSEAHSWYKHLPLLPPGEVFRFFINPLSGFDRAIQPGGHVIYKERTEDSFRFHYTWMTTAEYRSRFGHLTYTSGGAGTQIFMPSANGVLEYTDLPVFATTAGEYRIPAEVAREGLVELTALIHPLTAQDWVWTRYYPGKLEKQGGWPKETGGDAMLRRILELTSGRMDGADDNKLEELLLPERRRLHQKMTNVIYRMIVLIWDEK